MTVTFKIGTTYIGRSPCDHNSTITFEVMARTAKTVTARPHCSLLKGETLRITIWQGVEQVKPWGRYSMAPIIAADRPIAIVESTTPS
jgi:hypothetical protein